MLLILLFSCQKEKKSPVIGAWQAVPVLSNGWSGSNIKMWSENYCCYVGEYKKDTSVFKIYGGGPYKLDGTHAQETIVYNDNKSTIGQTYKMIYELKGDTLYQFYPVDDNWKYDPKTCNIDKYVRIK